MAYTLTKRELTTLKARLTRAKRSGDPKQVITVVNDAFDVFDDKGYPDCWHTFNIAREDARLDLERQNWTQPDYEPF